MIDFLKGLWRVIWIGIVSLFIGYISYSVFRMFDDIHTIATHVKENK